jgi:pimeloyl-ACP methyl ester carboxylesterase
VRTTALAGALIVALIAASAAHAGEYRITVEAAGQKPVALYAEETGDGPPVVLLHGLGASTFTWRRIVPELARTHRVIALDLKGFGRSDKPRDRHYSAADQAALVAAFLKKRDIENVTLIGHSFGGTVALLTALRLKREPQLIARLVIIDAPALWQNFGSTAELVRAPAVPEAAVLATPPEFMAGMLLRFVSAPGRKIPEADIEGYAAPFRDVNARHAFIATAQALLNDNTRRMGRSYRRIRQPTLLIWCRRDEIVPLKTGRQLAQSLPKARLAVLKGCNHLPQDESPTALLKTLRPFLSR